MKFGLAFHLTDLWLIASATFLVLLVAGEVGWRIGLAERDRSEAFRSLVSGIAAAVLGFLGLLLGFSLSMAISRYDARRAVIVDEANAIGTLWLRAGLLDAPLASELRGALRTYADARLALGRFGADLERLKTVREQSAAAQRVVWSVVERSAAPGINPAVLSTVVAAANEVIDLDELRMSSLENYVPVTIVLLLIGVAAVALAFLGWSFGAAGQRSVASMILLASLLTAVLTVLLDFNRPHRGLIRVGDESLQRLRQSIAEPANP